MPFSSMVWLRPWGCSYHTATARGGGKGLEFSRPPWHSTQTRLQRGAIALAHFFTRLAPRLPQASVDFLHGLRPPFNRRAGTIRGVPEVFRKPLGFAIRARAPCFTFAGVQS